MKAMSTTLTLAVIAIVLLITAVVVLTIFNIGITPALGLTEAKSMCQTQYATACTTLGEQPPTWTVQNMRVTEGTSSKTQSCEEILKKESITCTCTNRVPKCSGSTTSGTQIKGTTTGPETAKA